MPEILVREPVIDDIPGVIRYWFDPGNRDYHLARGTDPEVHIGRQREAAAFQRIIATAPGDRVHASAIVTIDGAAAGHIILNHVPDAEKRRMHFHMWRGVTARRSIGDTRTLTRRIITESLVYLFKTYPIEDVVGEVAVTNTVAGHVLRTSGFIPETTVIAAHAGESMPYHRYRFAAADFRVDGIDGR